MRRRRPEKREILPDPVYNDLVVTKFVNNLMTSGKKSISERIFYKSLERLQEINDITFISFTNQNQNIPKNITSNIRTNRHCDYEIKKMLCFVAKIIYEKKW